MASHNGPNKSGGPKTNTNDVVPMSQYEALCFNPNEFHGGDAGPGSTSGHAYLPCDDRENGGSHATGEEKRDEATNQAEEDKIGGVRNTNEVENKRNGGEDDEEERCSPGKELPWGALTGPRYVEEGNAQNDGTGGRSTPHQFYPSSHLEEEEMAQHQHHSVGKLVESDFHSNSEPHKQFPLQGQAFNRDAGGFHSEAREAPFQGSFQGDFDDTGDDGDDDEYGTSEQDGEGRRGTDFVASSSYFDPKRRGLAGVGPFTESDTDDHRVDSRASTGEEGGNVQDDAAEEDYDDNDEAEGQAQKRERGQRRDYYQRLIGDGLRAISRSYVTANCAIRSVEIEQRNMLEAENDIGEDLLKFGVCVREATQLMQAQLQEAFSKDDDDGPAPIERGQRGRSLESINCKPENKAAGTTREQFCDSSWAAGHGRGNNHLDSAEAVGESHQSNKHSSFVRPINPGTATNAVHKVDERASRPFSPSVGVTSREFSSNECGGLRHTADDTMGIHSLPKENSSTLERNPTNEGRRSLHAQAIQRQQTIGGVTRAVGGAEERGGASNSTSETVGEPVRFSEELQVGRSARGEKTAVPESLVTQGHPYEERGGVGRPRSLTRGGERGDLNSEYCNPGSSASPVKRPRWNSSLGDLSAGSGTGIGGTTSGRGGVLPSSLFRRSQSEARGGWARD